MEEPCSNEEVEAMREKFYQKVKDEGVNVQDIFDSRDLARLKSDDGWVSRFLIHHDKDYKLSLQMIWDAFKWRKEYKANDITEQMVPDGMLSAGAVFPHNRDIDGRRLFIVRSKMHRKGIFTVDQYRTFLIYWLERLEREEPNSPVSVMFDMMDAGLGHVDMGFMQLFIGLLKEYYPLYINWTIVFEMPWILNAAWKIIKGWLPSKAVARTKFLNKSTLKQIIAIDQQLKDWGGTDDFEYTFISEQVATLNTNNHKIKNEEHTTEHAKMNGNIQEETHLRNRKVRFESPQSERISAEYVTSKTQRKTDFQHSPPNEESPPKMFRVTPSQSEVSFTRAHDSDGEFVGSFKIKNLLQKSCLAFRIKITNPEQFRVRPSSGVIDPNSSMTISAVTPKDYSASALLKDKFLVMAMEEGQHKVTNDSWKQNNAGKEEIRLRCVPAGANDLHLPQNNAGDIMDLRELMTALNNRMKRIELCCVVILLFLILLLTRSFWPRNT